MIDLTFNGSEVFIQKEIDNQLVTELRKEFILLYDDIKEVFYTNINNIINEDSEESYNAASIKYEYFLESSRKLRESFQNIETALSN